MSTPKPQMRLSQFGGTGSPYEQAIGRFIELFGEAELGYDSAGAARNERDLINEIGAGHVVGGVVTTGTLGEINPGFFIGDLPYLWGSPEDASRFWKTPAGRHLLESVRSSGVRVMATYDAGTRNVFNRLRPIRRPCDMARLVMRTMPNRYHQLWLHSLGARTVTLPSVAIRGALESGVIDGAERSLYNYEQLGCRYAAPFFSLTCHLHLSACLVVSQDWWNGLGRAAQLRAEEAAIASEVVERERYQAMELISRMNLERADFAIIEPDLPAFRTSASVVMDTFRREEGSKGLLSAALSL